MNELIDFLILFSIYSFLGWCLETIFTSLRDKKINNRGFLTGCFCPIYGFSALLIITASSLITHYTSNYYLFIFMSLIFSIISVSLLEYVTGFILEKLFDCKWWDYSDNYANIQGYVCLKYSLSWGFVGFLLIRVVHPLILKLVFIIPVKIKWYYILILSIYFIIDTIKSAFDAMKEKELSFSYFNLKPVVYRGAFKFFYITMFGRDLRESLNEKIYKIKMQFRNKE